MAVRNVEVGRSLFRTGVGVLDAQSARAVGGVGQFQRRSSKSRPVVLASRSRGRRSVEGAGRRGGLAGLVGGADARHSLTSPRTQARTHDAEARRANTPHLKPLAFAPSSGRGASHGFGRRREGSAAENAPHHGISGSARRCGGTRARSPPLNSVPPAGCCLVRCLIRRWNLMIRSSLPACGGAGRPSARLPKNPSCAVLTWRGS